MEIEERAALHHALGEPSRLAMVDALALSDRAPGDLARLTGLPTNLAAFHLDVLERAGVVERRRSEGDARRRYVRLRPHVLPLAAVSVELPTDRLLFVCRANSARSQLAAALWERRTGRPASSAGTAPAPRVHPAAVAVAADDGLDLSDGRPRGYAHVEHEPSLVVAVCDRAWEDGMPFAAPSLHWSVPDPAGGDRRGFVAAYAELQERVAHLASATQAAA